MRIYLSELVKVFCKKSTIGIFIFLAVLNGILLYVNENQSNENYTAAQYKTVFADLDGLDAQSAYEQISLRCQKLELIQMLSFGEDISDMLNEYPNIDGDELMSEYESKSYLVYTDDIFNEQQLMKDVLAEVESCANYTDYLESIDQTAAKMASISLFADEDSFSYKNIQKTPDDFIKLKGSMLEVAPSKGVEMATDFLATDLIGFLMIMTISVMILTREKELNQIILSRTTFKGRKNLGFSKLLVCFSAAFVAVILLYIVNFAVSYFTYGFGDLSRQIQSVYNFNDSNLRLSVLEFFLLFIASKLSVYLLFAGLIFLFSVIFDSAIKVYASLFIAIALEAVLYYTIPSASYLCLFKYINILAYANTSDIFSQYLNLNVFSFPINYIPVFIVSIFLLILIFSFISIFVFDKKGVIKSKSKRLNFASLNLFKGCSTNLFLQECYKIFIGGKAAFILIIFLAAVIVTYKPMSESFSSADEVYYKQYMLTLEGEYNQEKQEYINAEAQKFEDAQNAMYTQLESADEGIFVMMKYQEILAPQFAFEQVLSHAEYLQTTENGEFVYDSGYKLLMGDVSASNKDLTLALTAMAVLICSLTYVYSVEYQTGANVLLKTSKRGRKTTFFIKLLIGTLIIAVIFILTYAPYFYNVLSTYGTRQIDAPLCSLEAFENWSISIKQYLILISVGRFLALFLAMLIIYFLSSKLKSFISTFVAATAILIAPILLSLLGIDFFDYFLLNPLLIGNL
ncbi:MAG: hypothetical protein LUE12_07525 [Ruminococcus sp.]|nr:hypothetical protein [Ruminococcus sp.]